MTFATHLERQFMQRLRGAGWLKASALPPSPRLVQTLLQKGWIETTKSGPKNVVLYRLTEKGLNAKKLPVSETRRTRTRPLAPSSTQARAARRYCSDSGHRESNLGHLKRTTPPNRIMLGSVVLGPDSAIPR